MRYALLIPLLLAMTWPALAGEEAQPEESAAEPAAAAAEDTPSAWEEWINTHAYDSIRRCWVPIPEGVEPGPKSGYIWNLGRWELIKIVHRPGYGWGYFDHRGRWHGQDERRPVFRNTLWRRRDYLNTLPKNTFEQPVLVKTLALSRLDCRRLEDLLQRNLIQELTLDDEDAVVLYERQKSTVSLSGRAELVAKLVTLITDESTYKAVTCEQPHGNAVEIISVVDARWLERDPESALNIADLNFAGLQRLVGARTAEHRRFRKALWFNETLGTVTVVDQPDTIQKVHEYLAVMPYAPKPDRMTIGDH